MNPIDINLPPLSATANETERQWYAAVYEQFDRLIQRVASLESSLGLSPGTVGTVPLTSLSGLGTGMATWLATPSSANLRSTLTDESGSGAALLANGALGTPASGTLTNCTLPVGGLTGLGANVATFLATPSSANLRAALTDETGAGAAVFADAPTFAGLTLHDKGLGRTQRTITGDVTVADTDTHLICNGSATINLTLPSAATRRELVIRTIAAFTVVSVASDVVPLTGGAAGTAILPATAGKWVLLVSDGTNWQIMMGN